MDLTTEIIAALLGAPTQNQRLLKLHTVLGPDVLLAERVEIEEGIGPTAEADAPAAGMRIVVQALSLDAHLELKQLIGQPALVELLTQASRLALRPWHGHVTRAELVGSDGGLARYRLTIEPWLAFLGHTRDAWVFQDQSVQSIVEEVFADYASQGKLAPAWRWELADPAVYPHRSLCIQYQESDLAFVQRLLREEGLFCWFEHVGDPSAAGLGRHTLVIADHNGAFAPNSQPVVRYSQTHVGLVEDTLTRWQRSAHVRTASLAMASPDHRSMSLRPVGQSGADVSLELLAQSDIPGAYAYEDSSQGERLSLRQMQAVDALRGQARASSNVRTTAPATTFTLVDHPVHDGSDAKRDRFVVLSARHRARNNLSADQKAQLDTLLGAIRRDNAATGAIDDAARVSGAELANATDEPIYRCEIVVHPAAAPVRLAALDAHGQPDVRLHPRPTVHGVQTALVVGGQAPVHTDRDHRIKVQFHWQRGADASHRLDHPAGGNAPASDASGTWVRVGESVAGANWGMNFTPRLGQEVLVAFVEGDIDRPVVVGSAYNGKAQADAQANQVAAGAAKSTGNAPAWFPGSQAKGRLQGHQHTAVLAGFKSQELATSQSGAGGSNQLVLDDTPGAGRIELASTNGDASTATRLQLGHLLQQTGNQRLEARGHGIDLATPAWGAVRAGAGLLISAHARPGSQGAGAQLDSREPLTSLQNARSLLHSLAESSQKQNARLEAEPDIVGATEKDKSRQIPVEQAHDASTASLGTADARGGQAASPAPGTIGGGTGTNVTAWGRPDLVVAAPGGVASFTPASSVFSAGNTLSLVATQDLQHLVQANHAMVSKDGLVLYTYGKAANATKPNPETGIRLHAASGSVVTQSQSGATKLTADKAIEVGSTTAKVLITAPKSILMTAGGAALDLQAGSITMKGPGKVEFKAAMKVIEGAGSAGASIQLPSVGRIKPNELEFRRVYADGTPIAGEPYKATLSDGSVRSGVTDAAGLARLADVPNGPAQISYGLDPNPPKADVTMEVDEDFKRLFAFDAGA